MLDGLFGTESETEETTGFVIDRRAAGEKQEGKIAYHPIGFHPVLSGSSSMSVAYRDPVKRLSCRSGGCTSLIAFTCSEPRSGYLICCRTKKL
jgi:hypothetical protein